MYSTRRKKYIELFLIERGSTNPQEREKAKLN